MDRAIYRSLTAEQRIAHLNSEMIAGKKLNQICREIGIADNVTTGFRLKGYIRDEQGLFIKQEQQHPGQMNLEQLPEPTAEQEAAASHNEPQEPLKESEDTITPTNEDEAIEPQVFMEQAEQIEPVETIPQPPLLSNDSPTVGQTIDVTTQATEAPSTFFIGIPEPITPTNEIQAAEPQIAATDEKKAGRPKREDKVIKLTIEIPDEVHRALMIYRADRRIPANRLIEELLRERIPEKYFSF